MQQSQANIIILRHAHYDLLNFQILMPPYKNIIVKFEIIFSEVTGISYWASSCSDCQPQKTKRYTLPWSSFGFICQNNYGKGTQKSEFCTLTSKWWLCFLSTVSTYLLENLMSFGYYLCNTKICASVPCNYQQEIMFFISLVLENVCLSTVNNEDLIYCTKVYLSLSMDSNLFLVDIII